MNLVVGATGVLGMEICRLLRERGKTVRALVRPSADADKKERLRGLGVQFAEGDLKQPHSLTAACQNIENVFSTATAIVSRQPEDSLTNTDRDGHFHLIDAAEQAGVRGFVFISFPPMPFEFPLQTAKREVENKLRRSKLSYMALQPTYFQEVWLGPHLGFDAANGKARIYGDGKNKISWISFRDVAKCAVLALEKPEVEKQILPLGGPEALSPLEVVRIFEEVKGKKFQVEHVSVEALQAQYDGATDQYQKSFTGLMLGYSRGSIVETASPLRDTSPTMQTIRQYASVS